MSLFAKNSPFVFMSHNEKDKPFIRRLAKDLGICGVKCWVDEAEIRAGDSLIQKIGDAIDNVDYLAVILSNNSVNSEWVNREVNIALTQEIKSKKIKVLPILLETCKIPSFLQDKLYIDFVNKSSYINSLKKLVQTCGRGFDVANRGWGHYIEEPSNQAMGVTFFYFYNEFGFQPIGIIPLETSTRFINIIYIVEGYIVIDLYIPPTHFTLFALYYHKSILSIWEHIINSSDISHRELHVNVFDPNEYDGNGGVEFSFLTNGLSSSVIVNLIDELVKNYNKDMMTLEF